MSEMPSFLRTARALPFLEVTTADDAHLDVQLVFAQRAAKLTWQASGDDSVDVVLDAYLPTRPDGDTAAAANDNKAAKKKVRASLRPQRGVAANIEALSEVKLQDADIDAAFVIHGGDPGLLLALVPELKELVVFPPDIVIDDSSLKISWSALANEHAERAVAAAFALWHRAVFFQIG